MFIQDGIKFVQHFAGAISESTPHLYLSGLPFSPSKSTLTNMLTANFPNIVQVVKGQHDMKTGLVINTFFKATPP